MNSMTHHYLKDIIVKPSKTELVLVINSLVVKWLRTGDFQTLPFNQDMLDRPEIVGPWSRRSLEPWSFILDVDVMAWSRTNMKINFPVRIKLLPFCLFSRVVHVPVQIFNFESVRWGPVRPRKAPFLDQAEAFAMVWKEFGASGLSGHRAQNLAERDWKHETENVWKAHAEDSLKCQRNAKRKFVQFSTRKQPSWNSCTKRTSPVAPSRNDFSVLRKLFK